MLREITMSFENVNLGLQLKKRQKWKLKKIKIEKTSKLSFNSLIFVLDLNSSHYFNSFIILTSKFSLKHNFYENFLFRILELKLDQQNLNVESLQCEMSGYCATIESQKMEIVELQAQLDAQLGENIDQVNIPRS